MGKGAKAFVFVKVAALMGGMVLLIAFVASALAGGAADEMAAEPGPVMEGPLGVGVPGRSYERFLRPDASEEDAAEGVSWTDEDWAIFEGKVQLAVDEGWDDAELGTAIVGLATSFVGTTYTPGTLESEGPEGLVINFRELDCVTFVETVLATTRFVRAGGASLLDDPPAARAEYESYLTDLRYRGGTIDGYPSRLHYFSEWLTDNAAKGLIEVATTALDPVTDGEQIDFMSTHPDAYRQLADAEVRTAIDEMESRLNAEGGRPYVPQDRIAAIADRIQDGDVIAATSTVEGLDIAHTGLALWRDGDLYLVHAPLVGKSVEISQLPLADRIQAIEGQDGIMVGRPLDPR